MWYKKLAIDLKENWVNLTSSKNCLLRIQCTISSACEGCVKAFLVSAKFPKFGKLIQEMDFKKKALFFYLLKDKNVFFFCI